jgi:hypothetical protein
MKFFWRRWTARGRRLNMALLRVFLRVVPSENQRVFLVALVAGGLCGLAAVTFHLGIIATENRLIDKAMTAPGRSWILWTLTVPTVGGLISGAILQYVVPGARGSGLPQVKVAYAVKGGRVPFRDALGKFLIGILQIGSGSSLGREGPRDYADWRLRTRRHGCGLCRNRSRSDHVSPDHLRDDRQLRPDSSVDDFKHVGLCARAPFASDADL